MCSFGWMKIFVFILRKNGKKKITLNNCVFYKQLRVASLGLYSIGFGFILDTTFRVFWRGSVVLHGKESQVIYYVSNSLMLQSEGEIHHQIIDITALIFSHGKQLCNYCVIVFSEM